MLKLFLSEFSQPRVHILFMHLPPLVSFHLCFFSHHVLLTLPFLVPYPTHHHPDPTSFFMWPYLVQLSLHPFWTFSNRFHHPLMTATMLQSCSSLLNFGCLIALRPPHHKCINKICWFEGLINWEMLACNCSNIHSHMKPGRPDGNRSKILVLTELQ